MKEVRDLTEKERVSTFKSSDFKELLEKLSDLGLLKESIILLEKLVTKEPENPSWSLMLAKLYLDSGELLKAKKTIDLLLTIQPSDISILELKTLISFQLEEEASGITLLKEQFNKGQAGERLLKGLLLADAMLITSMDSDAEKIYLLLANEYPLSPKPLIGLALLKRNQENFSEAQALLRAARGLRTQPDRPDNLIDGIASKWKLFYLRRSTYQNK